MKFSTTALAGTLAIILSASPVAQATDHAINSASKSEAVGVGAGVVIGAAVGGPVGAIIGAALGGHYGDTRHQSNVYEKQALTALDDLQNSRAELLESMTEQERLDFELVAAQNELDALTHKIDRLFVERALVHGLQFDVHFDTDDIALDEPDRNRLLRLSQLLKAVPEAEVELHGFADLRGDEDYNEALSLDRAYTVADSLNALGVAQSQIKTYAMGESHSTDRGEDVEAYSHDRRVSIRLQLPLAEEESIEQENVNAASALRSTGSGQ